MHTVEIENVDDIVRNELQWHYDHLTKFACDEAIVDALRVVLNYYELGTGEE